MLPATSGLVVRSGLVGAGAGEIGIREKSGSGEIGVRNSMQ